MGLSTAQQEVLEKNRGNMAEVKMKKSLMDMSAEDFPSNSRKAKEERKIVQAQVLKTKKSPGRKISETFLADDAHNVFSYIVHEVLIPAAKTTISDLVRTGIDRLLFGGTATSIRRRHTGVPGSTINYGNFHRSPYQDPRQYQEPMRTSIARRVRSSFEDIVLPTRDDAEEVLTNLLELIDNYGVASLADFYDLVGVPTTFVDYKHGWETLTRSSIVPVRDGFVLDLPRPIQLS